jgi:hypothetical protein
MLLYHLGFHPISSWGGGRFAQPSFLNPTIEAINSVKQSSGKPILMVLRPPLNLDNMKDFLMAQTAFVKAGVPVFHSMHQAGKAMARVITWQKRRID